MVKNLERYLTGLVISDTDITMPVHP